MAKRRLSESSLYDDDDLEHLGRDESEGESFSEGEGGRGKTPDAEWVKLARTDGDDEKERGRPMTCTLPPHSSNPLTFPTRAAFEAHYALQHTNVCSSQGCKRIFPSEFMLELHISECHDPIVEARKERGEKTFACFVQGCDRFFLNPKLRRLHLIDFHHYPRTYYFSLPNHGIGDLVRKYGPGASLVRGEWKPREGQLDSKGKAKAVEQVKGGDEETRTETETETEMEMETGMETEKDAEERNRAPSAPKREQEHFSSSSEAKDASARKASPNPAVTVGVAGTLASSQAPATTTKMSEEKGRYDEGDDIVRQMDRLALVPDSVRFGRGKARGFLRGGGKARGRGVGQRDAE